jgi:alpha-beta hydrolase superfamily lysophospholipase
MKGEIVRFSTEDGLKLQGVLLEPESKADTALIHVHGWVGNFYENKLIDFVARAVVNNGMAFLTFNNRGAGMITDFSTNEKKKYKRVGGSLEVFEDCVFDIHAAIDFLSERGYNKIILEGHSLGCQKSVYYMHKNGDDRVRGMVLLAPVDDADYVKRELGAEKYEKSLKIAGDMIKNGEGEKPVPEWMQFYPMLNAIVFMMVADKKKRFR